MEGGGREEDGGWNQDVAHLGFKPLRSAQVMRVGGNRAWQIKK
jgi:hypothetical protein